MYVPEVHLRRGLRHIHLGPQELPGSVAKAPGGWEGLRITLQLTTQKRQAQMSGGLGRIIYPQGATEDRKKQQNIMHRGNNHSS